MDGKIERGIKGCLLSVSLAALLASLLVGVALASDSQDKLDEAKAKLVEAKAKLAEGEAGGRGGEAGRAG
ncbi:MAG: hypothetical protein APR56_03735 [Methanosaeta sp. SDB]|nr:MAG: hypothetical protein APR56_03735 [Methanosaeta sp. SDB]